MSLLLPLLREACPERRQKAVSGLADGSLTLTLTRRTEREIRAIVRNGDGQEYGVSLTDRGAFCGCRDFAYRGVTCKHALAVAIFLLQAPQPVEEKIHLMWNTGDVLCGHQLTSTSRFWQRWSLNALNWSDLVCQSCVQTWRQPVTLREAA